MRHASARLYRAVCVITVLTVGCSGYIKRTAIDAIASDLQPSHSPIVAKLEASSNPTGQGVVVFVRSESDCAPRYSWIWLDGKIPRYALDEASRALTPALQTLGDATPSTLKRIGSDAKTLPAAIRAMMCQPDRR